MTTYSRSFFPNAAPHETVGTLDSIERLEVTPPAIDPADYGRRQQILTRELIDQQPQPANNKEDHKYWQAAWRDQSLWLGKAACRDMGGVDGYPFFPPNHYERDKDRENRVMSAINICANCPVKNECLGYAVKIGEKWGIRAGYNLGINKERQKAIAKLRQIEAELLEKALAGHEAQIAS